MIIKLQSYNPMVHKTCYIAESAEIIGRVSIGQSCSVWPKCVLRGDVEEIKIGNFTNIQENTVVHTNYGLPTILGDTITVGHSAVLHGCIIDDNCLIGMGAIILDGAKICKNCLIGAGALITEKKIIPERSLVLGSPGKIIRQLTQKEIDKITLSANEYIKLMSFYR